MELQSVNQGFQQPVVQRSPNLQFQAPVAKQAPQPPADRVNFSQEQQQPNAPDLTALTSNFQLPTRQELQRSKEEDQRQRYDRDLNRAFEALEAKNKVSYNRDLPVNKQRALDWLEKEPKVKSRDIEQERRDALALAEVDWIRRQGYLSGPRPTLEDIKPDQAQPGNWKAITDHVKNRGRR